MEVSGLSARVGRRLLKVARTLADLDSVEQSGGRADRVQEDHIHRAVGLRLEDADLPESR
jgi:predicted ATPase with chaperone activity